MECNTGQAKLTDKSALIRVLSWHDVEDGIQRLRETGMLDGSYLQLHIQPPATFQEEAQKTTLFTKASSPFENCGCSLL